MPTIWIVYGLAVLALATILGRVFWDALHERFDDVAMYLFAIAGAAVLVPYLLMQLPRVRKMKIGDFEVELAELERQLERVPGEEHVAGVVTSEAEEVSRWESESAPPSPDGPKRLPAWALDREQIKTQSRDVFLAHVLKPSKRTGQRYDVFVFLIAGKNGDVREVKRAEFFFGRYWRNRVFTAENNGGRVGVSTSAYGQFLAICRIEFVDGHTAIVSRFVDFEMGRLFDGASDPARASA